MQNRAIEIHDSTLDRISIRDGNASLYFAPVYIHQSGGTPGVDAGSGWVQKALIQIGGAVVKGSFSQLPRELLDGQIRIGAAVSRNVIPIPLDHRAASNFAWTRGVVKLFRYQEVVPAWN
jgi:hypothetical protein